MELVRCELGESQPDREGLQKQVWSEPDWSSSSGCLAIPSTRDTATVFLIALPKESPVLVIQEKGPVSPRWTHTQGVAAFLFPKFLTFCCFDCIYPLFFEITAHGSSHLFLIRDSFTIVQFCCPTDLYVLKDVFY